MRVELEVEGGFAWFPGLAEPIAVDAARLGAGDAQELQRLCRRAMAETRRSVPAPLSAMPDARQFRLTIEIGDARHELMATEPAGSSAIAALIGFVKQHGVRRPAK